MKSKRMAVAISVVSCVAAATMSVASAQETTAPRSGANRVSAANHGNAIVRQGGTQLTNRGRTGEPTMGERGQFTHNRSAMAERRSGPLVSRNGYGRDWQGDRRDFGGERAYSGGWRGDRGEEMGQYGGDRGYYGSPGYAFSSGPRYAYGPDAYGPGYDVGYGGPRYYDYEPGIGVGIGPFGIGIGPAWGW